MSSDSGATYLPQGLPIPVAEPDGLSAPYWAGLRQNKLLVQRCRNCSSWQFGPEWLCHRCHAFDLEWTDVEPRGRIFSWERVWHPSHPRFGSMGRISRCWSNCRMPATSAWSAICWTIPCKRSQLAPPSMACSNIIRKPIRRSPCCSGG